MMHQTLEGLLRIPRRQPSYPGQLCGRCGLRLCWSHNVSPPRVTLPRVLPSTGIYAGVNAVESLVARQENRREVFVNPAAWLPGA